MTTDELVLEISRYCNSYSVPMDKFNQQMSREHRTIQQTFTKLCLSWIEHVASDEYRWDGRNVKSKYLCKEILEAFANKVISDEGLSVVSHALKPSKYLGTI